VERDGLVLWSFSDVSKVARHHFELLFRWPRRSEKD
jgi:hypothetical protein